MHSLRKTITRVIVACVIVVCVIVVCNALASSLLHAQEPYTSEPYTSQNQRASYERLTESANSDTSSSRPNASASTEQSINQYSSTTAELSTRTPLPPPSQKRKTTTQSSSRSIAPNGALSTVFGSLAVVIGLFFLVIWLARRALPNAPTNLPKEVVEILGRMPFGNRQQMQLVRIGNKLLLLCNNTTGTDTLTEITDPEEVDRIVGLCQENQPGSISATFRQVLTQAVEEPAERELAQMEA